MATLIRVNGSRETVTPATPPAFTLEEMHGFVGGYIEVLQFEDGTIMVFNEEGKLIGLPYNPLATVYVKARMEMLPGDYIAGDAVVVSSQEMGE